MARYTHLSITVNTRQLIDKCISEKKRLSGLSQNIHISYEDWIKSLHEEWLSENVGILRQK